MKSYQDFRPQPRRSAWWGFIGYWLAVVTMAVALIGILYLIGST